jgi:hypothetical protein
MAEATQWKESVRPSDEAIVVRSRSDAAGDFFTASQRDASSTVSSDPAPNAQPSTGEQNAACVNTEAASMPGGSSGIGMDRPTEPAGPSGTNATYVEGESSVDPSGVAAGPVASELPTNNTAAPFAEPVNDSVVDCVARVGDDSVIEPPLKSEVVTLPETISIALPAAPGGERPEQARADDAASGTPDDGRIAQRRRGCHDAQAHAAVAAVEAIDLRHGALAVTSRSADDGRTFEPRRGARVEYEPAARARGSRGTELREREVLAVTADERSAGRAQIRADDPRRVAGRDERVRGLVDVAVQAFDGTADDVDALASARAERRRRTHDAAILDPDRTVAVDEFEPTDRPEAAEHDALPSGARRARRCGTTAGPWSC